MLVHKTIVMILGYDTLTPYLVIACQGRPSTRLHHSWTGFVLISPISQVDEQKLNASFVFHTLRC